MGTAKSTARVPAWQAIPAPPSVRQETGDEQAGRAKATDVNPCTCGECAGYIDYIIAKKKGKLAKRGVTAVPFVGMVATAGYMAKGAHKQYLRTKGANRTAVAFGLWYAMTEGTGCLKAKAIVGEICGHDKVEGLKTATDIGAGHIFKKIA